MRYTLNTLIIYAFCVISTVKAYYVEVNSSGSAVVGSTINFTATLYEDGKVATKGSYRYSWADNAIPKHTMVIESEFPYSNWSVEYKRDNKTKPGSYRVTLEVDKNYLIWFSIASNHVDFELTDSLIGKMNLLQDGLERKKEYVSTKVPVNHTIELRENDLEFLKRNATSIQTFWFRNCTYLGVSNWLDYEAIYEKEDEIYEIEALVVASFEKLPEPTTTTTTTTTSTTTPSTANTTSTTTTPTTTPKPTTLQISPSQSNTTTSLPGKHRSKRSDDNEALHQAMNETVNTNAALLGLKLTTDRAQHLAVKDITPVLHPEFGPEPPTPFNCVDKSIVARDYKKAYGYFRHRVVSKSPISNFTASGKNWLQHGDILNLVIKCQGSAWLQYCTLVFNAPYNATGNETCRTYFSLDRCEFHYNRYFSDSKTVLFFIRNDVSSTVNQVTINIYEAKKQSQLSVVVVPVSFTLVAVILAVFGVAYYLQSRNRFNIEVADFNFGDNQSVDMEYKTFQQRLIDSIRDVLPNHRRFSSSSSDLGAEPGSSVAGSVDSNLRYNTMS